MNETNSTKYGVSPETIEKKSLDSTDGEYYRELYDFLRLRKVENYQHRNDKCDAKLDKRKKKLRSPLNLDEKVLVLAERLKKKDAPSKFYKASTDNIPFFNREKFFTVYKRAKLNNWSYLYWVEDENNRKLDGRFLRQELFAVNNQFEQ